jgi:hypothetical protein
MTSPAIVIASSYELIDLPWLVGVLCIAIAGFMLIITFLETRRLVNENYLKGYIRRLVDDYKDPKIKFGGMLGIMRQLVLVGSGLVIFGLVLKGIAELLAQ